MTAEPPIETPTSGAAEEQPPHGETDRPRTTVYKHPRPALWVYQAEGWVHAWVTARQDYPNGAVVYIVEIPLPEGSFGVRRFAWGQDNIRPVD